MIVMNINSQTDRPERSKPRIAPERRVPVQTSRQIHQINIIIRVIQRHHRPEKPICLTESIRWLGHFPRKLRAWKTSRWKIPQIIGFLVILPFPKIHPEYEINVVTINNIVIITKQTTVCRSLGIISQGQLPLVSSRGVFPGLRRNIFRRVSNLTS